MKIQHPAHDRAGLGRAHHGHGLLRHTATVKEMDVDQIEQVGQVGLTDQFARQPVGLEVVALAVDVVEVVLDDAVRDRLPVQVRLWIESQREHVQAVGSGDLGQKLQGFDLILVGLPRVVDDDVVGWRDSVLEFVNNIDRPLDGFVGVVAFVEFLGTLAGSLDAHPQFRQSALDQDRQLVLGHVHRRRPADIKGKADLALVLLAEVLDFVLAALEEGIIAESDAIDACLSGYHPHPLHLGCSQSPE